MRLRTLVYAHAALFFAVTSPCFPRPREPATLTPNTTKHLAEPEGVIACQSLPTAHLVQQGGIVHPGPSENPE